MKRCFLGLANLPEYRKTSSFIGISFNVEIHLLYFSEKRYITFFGIIGYVLFTSGYISPSSNLYGRERCYFYRCSP